MRMFLAAAWVPEGAESGVLNPWSGEVVDTVPRATET
jgi:hypothetical protein